MPKLTRRGFFALIASAAAVPAHASGAADFDGSFGKQVAPGETMQLVLLSGQVIAFFWNGNYLDTGTAQMQNGGKSLVFTFKGGSVVLTRAGASMGVLLREAGKKDRRFVLPKG